MTLNLSQTKDALTARIKSFSALSSTEIPKEKRFRFIGACSALVVLGILALPRANSNAVAVVPVPEIAPVPEIDISRFDVALETSDQDQRSKISHTVKSGEFLGTLLQENGLSGVEAYRVTEAFSTVFKPRNVRVGHVFDMHFDGEVLTDLTFKPSVDKTVFVRRKGEDFTAKAIDAEFKMGRLGVKGVIENSLYLDANRLGAPDKVIQQFANIYEYSVDFQRDIQPGDSFEMFFEVARDHRGEIIKAGDLLYTSFSPRGKTSSYYLFEDAKGRENFYDLKGKTAKRKLRATPVNGARLSSSFGRRKHPILGYRKMHTGVDFAAPRGTPILAAGTGTVERASRYGGYGNYVRIKHSDGYKTAYAHMKNFARGIRAGARVRQDQVIGYVGTTGRSTGPHLHYEVILNGKKINPRRLSQLSGKPLAKDQIPAFKARQADIDTLRQESELVTNIPQAELKTVEAEPIPH